MSVLLKTRIQGYEAVLDFNENLFSGYNFKYWKSKEF